MENDKILNWCISNAVETIQVMDKDTNKYEYAHLNLLLAIALTNSPASIMATDELSEDTAKEEPEEEIKKEELVKTPKKKRSSKKEKVEETKEESFDPEQYTLANTNLVNTIEEWLDDTSGGLPSEEYILNWIKQFKSDATSLDDINSFTENEIISFNEYIVKWAWLFNFDVAQLKEGISYFSEDQLNIKDVSPDNIDAVIDFFKKNLEEE